MRSLTILAAVAALVLLAGCEPINPPSQPQPEEPFEEEPFVDDVSPPEVPEAATVTFKVRTFDGSVPPVAIYKTVVLTVSSWGMDGKEAIDPQTGERYPKFVGPRRAPIDYDAYMEPRVPIVALTINMRGQVGERVYCVMYEEGLPVTGSEIWGEIEGTPGTMGSVTVTCGPISLQELA